MLHDSQLIFSAKITFSAFLYIKKCRSTMSQIAKLNLLLILQQYIGCFQSQFVVCGNFTCYKSLLPFPLKRLASSNCLNRIELKYLILIANVISSSTIIFPLDKCHSV